MASIPIADVVSSSPLPIDAQDVATKIRLVVAGEPAGPEPSAQVTAYYEDLSAPVMQSLSYAPRPIVFEYEDPLHSTYGAVRSMGLEEGTDPFLPPEHEDVPEPTVFNVTNVGSPSAVRDGDPLTFAQSVDVGSLAAIFYAAHPKIVGFRLKYHIESDRVGWPGAVFLGRVSDHGTSPIGRVRSDPQYHLVPGVDGAEIVAVWPTDAHADDSNIPGQLGDTGLVSVQVFPHTTFKVYEFYPLILDEALLLGIAKANIQLPAQNPQRVTVEGFVAADREHTIVGWPGGDYTAVVAQHQYADGRTIIDFEQAGPPLGLTSDQVEGERARRTTTRSEIQSAGYGLKMGRRT